MQTTTDQDLSKRKGINLTIRQDVIQAARALHLNTSKAAESGIIRAIKEAQAEEWLHSNKKALSAHNERIAKNGVLLKPDWA